MLNDSNFLINKLEDMFLFADRNVSLKYTSFLDVSEVARTEVYIRSIKKVYPQVEYTFWGGYELAERKILCVYSSYLDIGVQDFPLKVVEFSYNTTFSKPTHRDFLGSIMALRLKRNSIGDIIVGNGKAQVVISSNVADVIMAEISQVGRLGVKTHLVERVTLSLEQSFKDISGTVASMRLDCMVGLALSVSRAKAVQIVKSGIVCVNYLEESSTDTLLKLNDVLTIKGYGKYVIAEISKPTKKNRLHILIKKYL
ncbi:MAG: YlmH/Sll1252 family protein [Ruminococcus sp.]|nr:YlmH/Sll1252 family protein [Ruminococcus sp.]